MKTIIGVFLLILGSLCSALAGQSDPLQALPPPTDYSVVDRGPNHKIWQRFEYEPGPDGQPIPRAHVFTELASGLEYFSSGWQDSQELISLLPNGGGAAATNGQWQLFLPPDIYEGVIEQVTPGGVHLRSRPLGLAYFNATSQASTMWAVLTNSIGQLLPSGNQVLYTNAFVDSFSGEPLDIDLLVEYRKSGIECEVVIRSKLALPDPADWGMNPGDTATRIQLWTDFFDTASPAIASSSTSDEDQLTDSTLLFGADTFMVPGKSFLLGPDASGSEAPVYKSWLENVDGGRTVLIEQLPLHRLKAQLDQLSALEPHRSSLYASANSRRASPSSADLRSADHASRSDSSLSGTHLLAGLGSQSPTSGRQGSAANPAEQSPGRDAFHRVPISTKAALINPTLQLPPRRAASQSKGKKMLLAQNGEITRPGLCLDYTTLTGSVTNYLFTSDMTYYISSTLSLCGTNTWEPGTVLKLASNASVTVVSGPLTPKLIFNSSAYKPIVWTCKDDSTVGESTGTGNPVGYYANPALNLQNVGNQSFSNVRFLYAQLAVSLASGSLTNYDSQFVNCQKGFSLASAALRLGNTLFANTKTNFSSLGGVTVIAQNGTFSGSSNLISLLSATNASTFLFTNSIFANVNSLSNGSVSLDGAYNGFYNATEFGSGVLTSSVSPFVTVGAGSYYLANDSLQPFRNAGTTNIDSALLTDLSKKTTYPPIVYSNVTISTATTFAPQAQRDTDIPDLGSHYDPIDYFFGGVTATSNLTFTAGTAAGWFELPGNGGPGYGISVNNGVTASFNGTETSPCIMARYFNVQEGGNGLWKDKGWLAAVIAGQAVLDTNNPGIIVASFLHSVLLAGGPVHSRDYYSLLAVRAANSEFLAGNLGGYNTQSSYSNCLMDRVYWYQSTGLPTCYLVFRNNTFHGGTVLFIHDESGPPYWFSSIRDSAFDNTAINDGYIGDPTSVDYTNNAFLVGAARTYPSNATDVLVTNSYNFQTSWLGNFYLPTNSTLINAGDVTADLAGLYHFTTQTNQVKETNSIVDIGYHYVAVDTNGVPFDTNGDGIPDYLSDSNGNGVVDSGEIGWNIPGDQGLKVLITRPRNNSVLP